MTRQSISSSSLFVVDGHVERVGVEFKATFWAFDGRPRRDFGINGTTVSEMVVFSLSWTFSFALLLLINELVEEAMDGVLGGRPRFRFWINGSAVLEMVGVVVWLVSSAKSNSSMLLCAKTWFDAVCRATAGLWPVVC